MVTDVHQVGYFCRLRTGRAIQFENIKPHNPSTEDWCLFVDMKKVDYLMMDPACGVKEKDTRDGNEVLEEEQICHWTWILRI